jgi:hypothetical protein
MMKVFSFALLRESNLQLEKYSKKTQEPYTDDWWENLDLEQSSEAAQNKQRQIVPCTP